ncbi:uncharacterized protein LOC127007021 [Eriocheir sinensis]|uniref:uncharacterized protein LOC127007021 n=1 Tax=Eriocheir sinensis TaxID=95602 RepID=UPI0021C9BF6F|nr:uncharacterized protein LOC127007021 [Eriocheir sinensis]
MTTSDGRDAQYLYTNGPSGFGNGVEFVANSKQCLVHKNYLNPSDVCTGNPKRCTAGLSLSLWYKGAQGLDKDWEHVTMDLNDLSIMEVIVSTGGDMKGHPGIAIYQQGLTTSAVVSTGAEYWNVSSIGMITNNKWTNMAISWSKDNGLQLYIDRSLVGSVKYPTASPSVLTGLRPSEIMLGCHKDATNTTYRGFNAAAFDELAIWNTSLVGDRVMYFMGGYIKAYEDVTLEEMGTLVDEADMNNPDIAAAAFEITAQKTYSEEVPSDALVAPPPPTTAATTTTTESGQTPFTTGDTAMITVVPDSKDKQGFMDKIKLHKKLIKTSPAGVEVSQLGKMLKLVDVVSSLFVDQNKEFMNELVTEMLETEEEQRKAKIDPLEITQDLSNWTLNVLVNMDLGNRTEMLHTVKEADNFIVNVFKAPLSKHRQGTGNYVVAPDCSMMVEKNSWNNTCNRVAVPNLIVTHPNCSDRIFNTVVTSSRNLHLVSPTTVNGSVFNTKRQHEFNSMMLSVEAKANPALTVDGKVNKMAPKCDPDPAALLETPIRMKFFLLNKDPAPLRQLKFHENEVVQRVESRHCVWWNANTSQWDSTGCVVMFKSELYTKCACAHFGMFAVMDELVEPKVAPVDYLWLTVLRYVGYALSVLFIIVYIITVLVSRDLKDQFHLMGMNLAVAVLVGSVAMVASDLHAVRDDRHWCTAIGTLIHFFCQAAGAWVICLGHAAHRAVTAGVIGGRLKSYLTISWGLPLISVGLTYLLYLMDLGEDPRCFISWENPPKFIFFGFQIVFVIVSGGCACVVLCNMSTTALRKDNLIDDYGSFCQGAAYLLLFFDVTWLFGIPCYIRLRGIKTDFYPIFQVLNSWMGVVLFLFIGLASRRFKMVVAGQAKMRREMLKGYAFGKHSKMKKDANDPGLSPSPSPAVKPKSAQSKAKSLIKSASSRGSATKRSASRNSASD